MKFGDEYVNPWASHDNPERVGYFVRSGRNTGKLNHGEWYEFTDKKGRFWKMMKWTVLEGKPLPTPPKDNER